MVPRCALLVLCLVGCASETAGLEPGDGGGGDASVPDLGDTGGVDSGRSDGGLRSSSCIELSDDNIEFGPYVYGDLGFGGRLDISLAAGCAAQTISNIRFDLDELSAISSITGEAPVFPISLSPGGDPFPLAVLWSPDLCVLGERRGVVRVDVLGEEPSEVLVRGRVDPPGTAYDIPWTAVDFGTIASGTCTVSRTVDLSFSLAEVPVLGFADEGLAQVSVPAGSNLFARDVTLESNGEEVPPGPWFPIERMHQAFPLQARVEITPDRLGRHFNLILVGFEIPLMPHPLLMPPPAPIALYTRAEQVVHVVADREIVDRFSPESSKRSDVVFVIDASPSAQPELARFRDHVGDVLDALAGRDFQLAFTGVESAGDLATCNGAPAIIRSTDDRSTQHGLFTCMIDELSREVYDEQPLRAARNASAMLREGFFREDARLEFFVMTDEASSFGPSREVRFFRSLKGWNLQRLGVDVRFTLFVGHCPPEAHDQEAPPTYVGPTLNALRLDLCSNDWTAQFERWRAHIAEPRSELQLSAYADPGSIEVLVDGVPPATGTMDFVRASNVVRFDPPLDDRREVEVRYSPGCP